MNPDKIPVWSWRHAIMKSKASAGARHVCHAISCDISDCGKFTQLTMEQLAEMTGMAERSIRRHIDDAEVAGLLRIERVRNSAGHVVSTRYFPKFPDGMTLEKEAKDVSQGLPAKLAGRGKLDEKTDRPTGQICKPTGQIGRQALYIETLPKTFKEDGGNSDLEGKEAEHRREMGEMLKGLVRSLSAGHPATITKRARRR